MSAGEGVEDKIVQSRSQGEEAAILASWTHAMSRIT
jgi:hypothetical protein